ncbi:MAG: hypothetical protein WEB06_01210 [Actinomycetota bacterium]
MMRIRGPLLIVVLLGLILPVTDAQALVCYSGERNTFVRRTGSNLFESRGVKGRVPIRNSALGVCPGFRDHHATVHMRGIGNNQLDAIEIGWFKENDGSGDVYRGFIEYQVNSVAIGYGEFGWNCATNTFLTPHSARFKTFNSLGPGGETFNWALYYDDDNNGTYCLVGSFTNTVMKKGLATGETGIFGGDDTNAYDHFNILYYATQPADAGWLSWGGNAWYSTPPNCIPGWGRHRIHDDDYEIQVGYPCPE